LRGYDYRTPALYHVVTCTHQGVSRFGAVREGIMHLSPAGTMIHEVWEAIPETFPFVSLDASVVMPNHHHGILFIEPQADEQLGVALGDVMRWFKTITTVRYSHGVRHQGWASYNRRLWHRNYYAHILRDERDLERVREYIEGNPANWDTGRFRLEGST